MIIRTRDRKAWEKQLEGDRKQLEEARDELEEARARVEELEDDISALEDDVLQGEERLAAVLGEKQKIPARKKERPTVEAKLTAFNLVSE